MNKCEFHFKIFYHKKKLALTLKKQEAVNKALVAHPMFVIVMAISISKLMDIEIDKINKMLISGPICGCSIVKNGMVDLSKTL